MDTSIIRNDAYSITDFFRDCQGFIKGECPQGDSNSHLIIANELLVPLSYGGKH